MTTVKTEQINNSSAHTTFSKFDHLPSAGGFQCIMARMALSLISIIHNDDNLHKTNKNNI